MAEHRLGDEMATCQAAPRSIFEELAMTSTQVLEIAQGSYAIEAVIHTDPIQRLYCATQPNLTRPLNLR